VDATDHQQCAPTGDDPLGSRVDEFLRWNRQVSRVQEDGTPHGFSLTNDPFTVKDRQVHIPKLGWVRMHDPLRFVGKVMADTISRTADRWFLSITVEIPDPPRIHRENQAVVGVDLGLPALTTFSTGEKVAGPKADAAALTHSRRLSKQFSCQMEAAKVHALMSNCVV
jgi:putative transposase